ncbi:MAG: hypothetical protein LBV56_07070 [Delftia acidovorans]|nr:hypothetical protein [Delftia acidovorans]
MDDSQPKTLSDVLNKQSIVINRQNQLIAELDQRVSMLHERVSMLEKQSFQHVARIQALNTVVLAIGRTSSKPDEIIARAEASLAAYQVQPVFLVDYKKGFEDVKNFVHQLLPKDSKS